MFRVRFFVRTRFVHACLGDRLMNVFINISTYLFAPLNGLAELREQLRAVCRVGELKGTIMLSPEGINLFVAGTRVNIDMFRVRFLSPNWFAWRRAIDCWRVHKYFHLPLRAPRWFG